MKFLSCLTGFLVFVGALNWLFVALQFNVVEKLFGSVPVLVTTIYWLVGLSAIYQLFVYFSKHN
ncbi:DUF378 domain-containing protein [Ectobacillus polymachus]|uniref:DUF378 domain-containing protein n=1 Tax=Ectobacillus polymachus TaxID=1508806 RepID=UPI003A86004C